MSGKAGGASYIETKAGPTFVRDGKAFVRSRDGALSQVDPSGAQQLFEGGEYLPASAEDVAKADIKAANSTLGAKAKTFAESAAAGAIDAAQAPIALPLRAGAAALGLPDPMKNISGRATVENAATIFGGAAGGDRNAEAYGREYGENARARAEANPGTALAGNVAGSLAAGGALSGGAGAVGGAAARALGGGAAARAAGAVATGALEGAAYGQAQAGEEAYLHNIPLTAEKLIAAMGWGAVLGGGVSLAAHGAGALLRRGSRGATPVDSPRLPGELDDALDAAGGAGEAEAVEGAAAAPSKLSSGLREFADERTAKALGANVSQLKAGGRTGQEAAQLMHDVGRTVRDMTLDDGSKVFNALDDSAELADRVARAKVERGEKLAAFRSKADEVFTAHPEIAPKPDAIADRIEKEVLEPLMNHPSAAERGKASEIRKWIDDIRAQGGPQFEAAADGNGRKLVTPRGEPMPVNRVQELTKIRQSLGDEIYNIKTRVNLPQQGLSPADKELGRVHAMLEESIEAASDKAATYFGKADELGYKQLKTDWRRLNIADQWAQAGQLNELGRRVVSPSDYGVGAVGAMLGGGPVAGLLAGVANKVARERSSAVLAVVADKLANSLDGKIESGLGAFFRESTQRASAATAGADRIASAVPIRRIVTPAAVEAFTGKSKDLQKAYEKRVAELTDATRDMGAGVRASMAAAMGGGAETMPRLTQAATMTATRGAQYLESQLPSGTAAPTVFQPSRKISPSDLQIREFAQKWAAVANPLSVIDDLRRGTVTHAQIDALKAVYPELYADVQGKALDKIRELDEQGKRMPFNDRLQLDLFLDLGGAGEPTLAGKFIDRVAGLQAAKAAQDSKPKGSSSGAGSLQKIGASRMSGAQGIFGGSS